MKKFFLTLTAMSCSLASLADEAPGIIINKSDGSNVAIAISALRNIKFSDGNMIVNMKDDSQQSISLDDVTYITFDDVATAVKTLTRGTGDSQIMVTDLSGRVLYKGNANNVSRIGHLHGVYVITVNGNSHKINIGK